MGLKTPSRLDSELREELKTYYDEESWEEIETLEKDIDTRVFTTPEVKNLAEFMRLEFRNDTLKLYKFLDDNHTGADPFTSNIDELMWYLDGTYANTEKQPLQLGNIPSDCPTGLSIPPPAKKYRIPIVLKVDEYENLGKYISDPNACKFNCFVSIENSIKKYGVDYTGKVYRGQGEESKTIIPCRFFSTTSAKSAGTFFSGSGTCCFFTINLVKARALDIDLVKNLELDNGYDNYEKRTEDDDVPQSFMPNLPSPSGYKYSLTNEAEILVLGGGKFFQDEALTIPGFKYVDERNIETYYTHSKNGGGRRKTKKHTSKSTKTRRRSRK